jgi:hypothetical protein
VTPDNADFPGDKVVTFTAPPPTEFTSIGIEVSDTGEPVELENHVNSYLVALETALPGYTLVQSPDCARNALGGQKTYVYIYTVAEQSGAATTDGSFFSCWTKHQQPRQQKNNNGSSGKQHVQDFLFYTTKRL